MDLGGTGVDIIKMHCTKFSKNKKLEENSDISGNKPQEPGQTDLKLTASFPNAAAHWLLFEYRFNDVL